MMARVWIKSAMAPALALAAAAALVGCQSDQPVRRISADGSSTSAASSSSSAATSTTPAKPVRTPETDVAAISALFERERQANENYDIDALVDVSCAQYKDATRAAMMKAVQPMSSLKKPQPPNDPAAVKQLASRLQEMHPKMSSQTAQDLAAAWGRQDEAAFDAGQRKMLAEITVVQDWKVDNIKVTGDTATADVTMTTVFDQYPPQTQNNHVPLLIENGEWKDCFPPPQG